MGLDFSSRALAIAGESFRGQARLVHPSLFFLRFLPELARTHAAEGGISLGQE
jgi:hypothetical protein